MFFAVFSASDILDEMPEDGERFTNVDTKFRLDMAKTAAAPHLSDLEGRHYQVRGCLDARARARVCLCACVASRPSLPRIHLIFSRMDLTLPRFSFLSVPATGARLSSQPREAGGDPFQPQQAHRAQVPGLCAVLLPLHRGAAADSIPRPQPGVGPALPQEVLRGPFLVDAPG